MFWVSKQFWSRSIFGLAIFTSAFLLFQVQLLLGKFLLPWFGGTSAVWATCLLFFQVVLFSGDIDGEQGTSTKTAPVALVHVCSVGFSDALGYHKPCDPGCGPCPITLGA